MPSRSVSLTEEQDNFVTTRVASGQYESTSELMTAAFRSLEEYEREQAEKMAYLRKAIADGLASGTARGDVFARVRRKAGLPAESR